MQRKSHVGITMVGVTIILIETVFLLDGLVKFPNEIRMLAVSASIGGGTTLNLLSNAPQIFTLLLDTPSLLNIVGNYLGPILSFMLLLSGLGILGRNNIARLNVLTFSAINILFVAAGTIYLIKSTGLTGMKDIFALFLIRFFLNIKLLLLTGTYLIFLNRPKVKKQFERGQELQEETKSTVSFGS